MEGYANREFWVFREVDDPSQVVETSLYESLMSHKALFIAPINREDVRLYPFDRYVAPEQPGEFLSWFIFVFSTLLVIIGIANYMSVKSTLKPIAIFLLIWILPFTILFQLFNPYMSCYRLFYLLPIIIFLMKSFEWASSDRRTVVALNILLGAFIFVNFTHGFFPESIPDNNPYYRFAITADTTLNDKDLAIFYPQDYFYAFHLRYFSDCKVMLAKIVGPSSFPGYPIQSFLANTNETANWINSNFDHVYISRISGIPFSDYEKLSPRFVDPLPPKVMILSKYQLINCQYLQFDTFNFMSVDINPTTYYIVP